MSTTTSTSRDLTPTTGRASHALLGWAVVLAAALLLYAATAARVIQWQDSGSHVLRIVQGEVTNPLGLALAHPLFYWLGRAFVGILPVEPAHAVSLVSALAGAVAVANVFGLVRQLCGRVAPAVLAAASLAVAHTFWQFSTIPESYTLAAALLTAEMWCLVLWAQTRRPVWLVTMFLASGLGLANHNLALLTLPVVATVLLLALWYRQAGWRTLLACVVGWLVGASSLLVLVVQEAIGTGDVSGAIHSMLFGRYESHVKGEGISLRLAAISVAFTVLSFPNLTLLAAVLGAVRGGRLGVPRLAMYALLAALGIHLLFVLRYSVVDQYTFLVPAYALIAVLAGLGYAYMLDHWSSAWRRAIPVAAGLMIVVTPLWYVVATATARHYDVLGAQKRDKPYRDDYAYLLLPWGVAETSAERMSSQALDLAGERGLVIVEDGMGMFAVQYQRLMRDADEVDLIGGDDVEARIAEARRANRPVVLVPARRGDTPPAGYDWRREGDLYVLP